MSANLSDNDRRDFLQALDHAPFEVNNWEATFMETALKQTFYSARQRSVIEKMINKYGGRMRWEPAQRTLGC